MNPKNVLAERLAGMPIPLTHAVQRSVYFLIDDEWRLAAARLTFTDKASENERHDHRDFLFLARCLSREGALAGLRQMMDTKSPPALELERCPPFNQLPDVLSRPESLPLPYGQGKRLTGWPEFRFRFRGEHSMNAPNMPIVRPGVPIIADAWEAIEAWMHEPRTHDSTVALDVVVPRPGARITRLAIGPESVRVHVEGEPGARLDVRMHFSGPGEVEVRHIDGTFSAGIEDLPNVVTVFLVDAEDDVLDWAQVRPRDAGKLEGVEVSWPLSTFQDAIARGEGESTEFKSDLSSKNRDDVLSTVSAFANGKGGSIYFGVHDNGTIHGVQDAQRTMGLIHEWCNTLVDPRPEWNAHVTQLQGVEIVILEVRAGPQHPYQVKSTGKCHVRRGASDFPMTRDELLSPRNHPSFPMGRRRIGF